jgi:hypothetical protein
MPRTPSLDEFIAEMARQFAENVKNATDLAHTEEDVRIEVERQLGFIQREAGVELEELHGQHGSAGFCRPRHLGARTVRGLQHGYQETRVL